MLSRVDFFLIEYSKVENSNNTKQMVLAPNDFYAYSQATGTQYPESAEERARLVPEVRRFRQSQLRAPAQEQSGPDLSDIAMGAGLFGMALATGMSAAQGFGGRARSTVARPRSGNEGIVQGKAKLNQLQEKIASEKVDRALDSKLYNRLLQAEELSRKDLGALQNIQKELKGSDQWVMKDTPASVAPSKTVDSKTPAMTGYRDFNRSVD